MRVGDGQTRTGILPQTDPFDCPRRSAAASGTAGIVIYSQKLGPRLGRARVEMATPTECLEASDSAENAPAMLPRWNDGMLPRAATD